MSQMADAVQKQEEDIKVWAQTKKISKRKMAECIIKFALRTCVQADQLHLDEIKLALTKPVTYITKTGGAVAIARAKALLKLMVDNNAELTIILPADITEMEGVIADYETLENMPKNEIDEKKSAGTAMIAAIQKEIDKDKEDIRMLVHSYLPELAASYDAAAKVGLPTGTKKLKLSLHITDAVGGSPLYKVLCKITNGVNTIDVKSGKKGFAKFYGLDNGLWNVTAELANYATFKQTEVSVSTGKIVKMEIKIKKNTLADKTIGNFSVKVFNQLNHAALAGLTMKLPAIDKTYVSDALGVMKDEGLEVGAYAAIISGPNVKERSVSFMVEGGETCEVGFGMEVV
jgi:hypothetical protein